MSRRLDAIREGRSYFEEYRPPMPPSRERLRERWAIQDIQAQAWVLRETDPAAAAALYDQAAARWEALGIYSDFASSARYEARRLRKAAP